MRELLNDYIYFLNVALCSSAEGMKRADVGDLRKVGEKFLFQREGK